MKQFITLILFSFSLSFSIEHVYAVILAGGSGERMWPLSRSDMPKQLLSLDGKSTFLDQAIERIERILPRKNIFISTTQDHEKKIKEHVNESIKIIVEPEKKDTGPALLFSCIQIQQQDPEAIVIFLPSDQYIPCSDYEMFIHSIEQGINFMQTDQQIVLFGVNPTYPSIDYGYIEFDRDSNDIAPFKIIRFFEKPTYEYACDFVDQGMLWNQCMFGAKVSVFIDEFNRHAPDIVRAMNDYLQGKIVYADIRKISVDFAIMEKSQKLWVIPCDYQFIDIGNIDVYLTLKGKLGFSDENVIELNSHNNLVDAQGCTVALLGIDNVCVVRTNNIIFVAKRDELYNMRNLVTKIKEREKTRNCL